MCYFWTLQSETRVLFPISMKKKMFIYSLYISQAEALVNRCDLLLMRLVFNS